MSRLIGKLTGHENVEFLLIYLIKTTEASSILTNNDLFLCDYLLHKKGN